MYIYNYIAVLLLVISDMVCINISLILSVSNFSMYSVREYKAFKHNSFLVVIVCIMIYFRISSFIPLLSNTDLAILCNLCNINKKVRSSSLIA